MLKAVIFYHANCNDGFGAAWAAWKHFGDTAVYQPMQYGDAVPAWADVLPPTVPFYVVDFSFPRAIVGAWMAMGRQFTIIDHHKTAMEELGRLPFDTEHQQWKFIFDVERSGAVLTWIHFHPDIQIPTLLQYVQDRDLWKQELPQSAEHAACLSSYERTFQAWDHLAGEPWFALLGDGKAILRAQAQQVKEMAERMVWRTIGGYHVPVVNATVCFSDVGHALASAYSDGARFAAYYFDRADGKRQWGLRALPGFDCTTVAKQYGGGGHPGAAGFVTDQRWQGE